MQDHHDARAPQRTLLRMLTISVLGALLLTACASNSPTSSTPGGTGGSTATTQPGSGSSPTAPAGGATAGATTTPTPSGAFSAAINESFTAAYCTSGQPAGSVCLTGDGSGRASPLGAFTFHRTAVMLPGGADSCGPSTTQGTFTMSSGDTVTFKGTGTFCRATQTAQYTYTITGGTGAGAGAKGSGTIHIPTPSSSTTDTQTWSGTLMISAS